MASADSPRFRRPAMLYPAVAEAIPGAPDPATALDLAHDSARALLDGVFHSEDPEVVQRVISVVEEEGLGDLAALWSTAPPSSLPGALWRLYVLHTWVSRHGEEVVRRYRAGSRTIPGLRYLSGISEPPELPSVQRTMDDILRGAFTGDLSLALIRAGSVATLLAHGTAHIADDVVDLGDMDEHDDEGEDDGSLTAQAGRLLRTGEELIAAGRHAEAGTLD